MIWKVGQIVFAISEFHTEFQEYEIKNHIENGKKYRVLAVIKHDEKDLVGLILEGHDEVIGCDTTKVIYDATGFMPYYLWVENSNYVDKFMRTIL